MCAYPAAAFVVLFGLLSKIRLLSIPVLACSGSLPSGLVMDSEDRVLSRLASREHARPILVDHLLFWPGDNVRSHRDLSHCQEAKRSEKMPEIA